jgi:hypothetical protein
MPTPNQLPPDNRRPIQPLDVRRRREIKVYAEIFRIASQTRTHLPAPVAAQMAREIIGRLEKEGELNGSS